MSRHEKIDYVEFAAKDLEATKSFFQLVFGWHFTDYGKDYCDFDNAGIKGGFYRANLSSNSDHGGALIVFYSDNLLETQAKIEQHGGIITQSIFSFPGGSRFHFCEPSGNEFAVWTEQEETP